MRDLRFFCGNEILKVVKIEDLNGDYPEWLIENFSFDKPYIDEYIRAVRDIYAFVLINVKGDKKLDHLTKSQYEQIFGSEDKTPCKGGQPKQNIKIVNVLGTEYEVELLDEQNETMKLLNCVGYTDKTTLYECGIDIGVQFHNEECVDFFAMQFPKLAKLFEDAGCKE